jgi:putative inorganic carbon (hco3(-)) transporter
LTWLRGSPERLTIFARASETASRQLPAISLLLALLAGILLATLPLPLAAGLVGATAVLLLILIWPLFGLACALLAGPFGALEKVALGNSFLDSGQLFLWLALASWLGRVALRRQLVVPRLPLNLPLLFFVGAAAVTIPGAIAPIDGLKELLKWIEVVLVVWMVVDEFGSSRGELSIVNCQLSMVNERRDPQTRKHATRNTPTPLLLLMLFLPAVVQALIGIWQFGLRGYGPEHFAILGQYYRAYGTFEQPNPFGGYMGLNAALALGTFLGLLVYWQRLMVNGQWSMVVGRWSFVSAWLWFLFAGLAAAVTSLALVLSWSRGAWLGFGAAVAVLALFWPRRRWLGLLVLAVAMALFGAATIVGKIPPSLTNRLVSIQQDFQFGDVRGAAINDANYAVLERLAYWQAAVDMAREQVWFGVGFGNYAAAYPQYALINWPFALGHAHNYYLNLLAEVGLVGTAAYLVFWFAVFWQTLYIIKHQEWPWRGVGLGLLSAWVYLSVHHLVDKLYVNNIYLHLAVMLALLQLLYLKVLEFSVKREA